MSTKRTYWIDLTDLVLWQGHHTGIQRVVYNIARYYAESGEARFFFYDEKHDRFDEVPFSEVEPPAYMPDQTLSYRRRLKQRVIYEAKNRYSLLPPEWREQITPRVKPVLGRVYRRAYHTAYVTKNLINRPVSKLRPVPAEFGPNDAIIILGAGWVRPGILEALWRRKQVVGFKIFHFIHDIIPVYFPHLFGPGHFELSVQYFFDVAATCDGIIANSECTKRDMARFCEELNLPRLPINVIRLGDEIPARQPVKPTWGNLEPGKFILTTGTIENRKNHALLYYAYKLAAERGIEMPKLVIVGRQGWNTHDLVFTLTHDPELRDNIVIKGAHDVELAWLLENCLYSIYPTTYEGWGLPVAEALVMGKLCLTTNVSSLTEIAGDLIDYFSPFDSGQCLDVMLKYLDPDTLKKTEARIRKEYQVTTWEQCYRDLRTAVDEQLRILK